MSLIALALLIGATASSLVFVEPTPERARFVDALELELGEDELVDTATARFGSSGATVRCSSRFEPQAFAGWWQTPGVTPQLGLLVSAA